MFKLINNINFKIKHYFLKRKLIKYIDSGKLIHVDRNDRGIGKTYALAEIAKMFDIPILVCNKFQADILNDQYRSVKYIPVKNYNQLRGYKFENGVLIEEGFDEMEIKYLYHSNLNIRTGFYYANYLVK